MVNRPSSEYRVPLPSVSKLSVNGNAWVANASMTCTSRIGWLLGFTPSVVAKRMWRVAVLGLLGWVFP